ncbi:hypothetical protein CCM_04048 [Cordyceps militaris CM01]|uniref:Uncharacterized protein n=1 Tax=Cordyceps militaris (strain CM01) TaxID=983644 RepID=G3JDK0_CORMM|nr:uncharacterized protein CCM_04048 [Cordyceps militaris CM01]EGX92675.1 hypothetical protein CCM_04048 [Cordyceps militaris CM01]
MQTVPSLVGTGTAIAAAASGLVFGHLADSDRPAGRRNDAQAATLTQVDSRRNSLSSNGSWMRRFSFRAPSQHGSSPRSSMVLDRQSVALSHTSTAPILRPKTAAPNLPPNKLVKRCPSTHQDDFHTVSRSRSKGHLPTLRRPATSHQRTATLEQLRLNAQENQGPLLSGESKYSFEQRPSIESACTGSNTTASQALSEDTHWSSFFHSRRTNLAAEQEEQEEQKQQRRAAMQLSGTMPTQTGSGPDDITAIDAPLKPLQAQQSQPPQKAQRLLFQQPQQHPQRRQHSNSRRSSPQHPLYGASSSAVLATTTTASIAAAGGGAATATATAAPPTTPSSTTTSPFHASQSRNLSSPLTPPPQRARNFQIDNSLPRPLSPAPAFGPAGGVAVVATTVNSVRPLQPSTSSTASSAMPTSQQRSPYYEASPQMEAFDSDGRGFTSGDDDDTDFKSDTLYDSLRTVASSRARAVDTPLESVYDESPPSTASNGKSRRLSIHAMLDKAWDGDDRITEEDEASQTPVRAPSTTKVKPSTRHDTRHGPSTEDLRLAENPIHSSFPSRDFARMSLEDDFDDDWARYEDEADSHISPLSAPSKSSLNAKGMNPNVRLALANMTNGSDTDENPHATERPLSNIFDWSEPSTQDKNDAERRSGRPQTASGKQAADPRGGRSANRRGPAPAHVRSQSVPVVHDVADESKSTAAKYGTWGLSTKTVSEDWDEDFEFGSVAGNDGREDDSMFAVPESIRASQPSVKAHSGQIRELSLLVNDLKRLCRHGREMGLLEGSQKAFWKEAEGVIALASPDDETMDDDVESNPSVDLDAFDGKAKQTDLRPRTPPTDPQYYLASPKLDSSISKTAVMRERHSPRRRSVFSPDDDIFGGAESSADKKASPSPKKTSQKAPKTPERLADVNGVVRTVMEAMQHRSDSDAIPDTGKPSRKVQFDTNSLRALVKRSGELRDTLSDIIRRTDQLIQSPARPLRHDRDRGPDSSPAFTRVFDDPGSSPPRRVTRSRANTSLKQTTSPDSSPPPQLERRFPLMTVR